MDDKALLKVLFGVEKQKQGHVSSASNGHCIADDDVCELESSLTYKTSLRHDKYNDEYFIVNTQTGLSCTETALQGRSETGLES